MIEYFKKLYDSIDLNERYAWDINDECPIILPSHLNTNFQKNKYLKLNLNEQLIDLSVLSAHYWVIQHWGGIKSFKRNESNDEKIRGFFRELTVKKLSKNTFSTISSLSKLSSFKDYHNYFIYDARAIFALNWIIIKSETPLTNKLFPQPIGRNSTINRYDLGTIVNLSNKKFKYYDPGSAYFQYCNLLTEMKHAVCPKEETFVLEMLLFVASVDEIVHDLRETIQIKIQ